MLRPTKARRNRQGGSIIVCVLVVVMLVTMLAIQTMQSLSLIRRSDDDRARIRQAREALEFGKMIAATKQDIENNGQKLRLTIADSIGSTDQAEAASLQVAEVQILNSNSDSQVTVRYPLDDSTNKTTEITLLWENKDDSSTNK